MLQTYVNLWIRDMGIRNYWHIRKSTCKIM